jgi:hypothetical protein
MQRCLISKRIFSDSRCWFGKRRRSRRVPNVCPQSFFGNAGADQTQASKSDDRCETSSEHGSLPRWDVTANSGRERCGVQRWEVRLQTHRCMLTRFCVVSQSESLGSHWPARWCETCSRLMWAVRFALTTDFSSLTRLHPASLMSRLLFVRKAVIDRPAIFRPSLSPRLRSTSLP